MKTVTEKKDLYEVINNTILDKIKQGTLPWQQAWNSFGLARNYVTGKPYRGINALILNNIRYEYPLYMTYLQAKESGGYVKKGATGIPVIFWKKLRFENGEDDIKIIPYLRYYTVFNIECIDGIEFKLPQTVEHEPIPKCVEIVDHIPDKPTIEYIGDKAYYNPKLDKITVPKQGNFKTAEAFYATLFHELVHSTGHESRLNREGVTQPVVFGSRNYCKEELIAEIATCFLCVEAGIENNIIENSAAYIKMWNERLTQILKEDKKAFIKASAQAQKAADYILNRVEEVSTQE